MDAFPTYAFFFCKGKARVKGSVCGGCVWLREGKVLKLFAERECGV